MTKKTSKNRNVDAPVDSIQAVTSGTVTMEAAEVPMMQAMTWLPTGA
jgi:hypothetical protein